MVLKTINKCLANRKFSWSARSYGCVRCWFQM